MSVYIPSGYADRNIDHHSFVTFYIRDSLKRMIDASVTAKNAFTEAANKAAVSLHVYNGNTHAHWHKVADVSSGTENALSNDNVVRLKELLARFGQGSMVVVARNDAGSPECQAHEEKLAEALRSEGLIQSAEQFLIVQPAKDTKLSNDRLVSRLQLA